MGSVFIVVVVVRHHPKDAAMFRSLCRSAAIAVMIASVAAPTFAQTAGTTLSNGDVITQADVNRAQFAPSASTINGRIATSRAYFGNFGPLDQSPAIILSTAAGPKTRRQRAATVLRQDEPMGRRAAEQTTTVASPTSTAL